MFSTAILCNMGLLTILKKMKQKEKEMRLLMLYPLKFLKSEQKLKASLEKYFEESHDVI